MGSSSSTAQKKRSRRVRNTYQDDDDDDLDPSTRQEIVLRANYLSIPNQFHRTGEEEGLFGLVGLKNLGNTCFINSAVQCLSHTQPLADYFMNNLYEKEINSRNRLGTGGVLSTTFGQLINDLWTSEDSEIYPIKFLKGFKKHAPQFIEGYQEDAQEFLSYLLDGLHEDLNRVKKKSSPVEIETKNRSEEEISAESWFRYLKQNQSIIVDLFQGQLKSTVICRGCRFKSLTFDTFMYLTLPIPSKPGSQRTPINLEDCINLFTREEILKKDDGWRCPNCKKQQDAIKRLEIWKLPPILVIYFKRFTATNRGGYKKNSTPIRFPLENLSLSQYSHSQKEEPNYDLFAVSNHEGGMNRGHYTTVIRHRRDRKWYAFSDTKVRAVSSMSSPVSSSKAYVLFYANMSMKHFRRQSTENPRFWPHVFDNESAKSLARRINIPWRHFGTEKVSNIKLADTAAKNSPNKGTGNEDTQDITFVALDSEENDPYNPKASTTTTTKASSSSSRDSHNTSVSSTQGKSVIDNGVATDRRTSILRSSKSRGSLKKVVPVVSPQISLSSKKRAEVLAMKSPGNSRSGSLLLAGSVDGADGKTTTGDSGRGLGMTRSSTQPLVALIKQKDLKLKTCGSQDNEDGSKDIEDLTVEELDSINIKQTHVNYDCYYSNAHHFGHSESRGGRNHESSRSAWTNSVSTGRTGIPNQITIKTPKIKSNHPSALRIGVNKQTRSTTSLSREGLSIHHL
mmetsp:Transcript_18854/g.21281  ORF Transcript_18854/g.21281 Transcript_18854/m.21281 type:complete len:736 (-) Transcript_18854:215-2422(-)